MLSFHRLIRTWRRKVDIFFCPSSFYRDLFTRAGWPSEKIVVMPHFVSEEPGATVLSSHCGEYALFVGRLDPEKGVRTLLEAWRFLDIPLKIRGSGQLEQMAKTFVEEHGVKGVEFIDRLDARQLSQLMSNARVLVVPSEGYYETFGLVIIEAYSRGVPVVASRIGVATELVVDGTTGLLFEAGNPIDLANKVKWLWTHPAEACALGRNAFERYRERYTKDRCYQILVGGYEKAIASHTGSLGVLRNTRPRCTT